MEIYLYTTHCPKCLVLEKKLEAQHIDYEEINDVNIMLSKGYTSVPILEVDNVPMNFVKANDWINQQKGK